MRSQMVKHEPHVVVDQQRRGARVRDLPEPLAEVLALARVEAGRGLVEAEEPRLHRDRPRHADELPLTLRQLGRHRVRDAAEVEQLERLVGRLVRSGSVARRPPPPAPGTTAAPLRLRDSRAP